MHWPVFTATVAICGCDTPLISCLHMAAPPLSVKTAKKCCLTELHRQKSSYSAHEAILTDR